MKTTHTFQAPSLTGFNQFKHKYLKLKMVFIVSLMLASVAFTSCNKDDDSVSAELIGTWFFEENIDGTLIFERLTFNSNNTGNLIIETTENGIKQTETMEFTFTNDGKMLDVSIDRDMIQISYSIADKRLTITEDGDTTTYTRVEQVGGSNMNVAIF